MWSIFCSICVCRVFQIAVIGGRGGVGVRRSDFDDLNEWGGGGGVAFGGGGGSLLGGDFSRWGRE